jgi:glycosyltransferase involved in cell wall biosynthesis
MTKIAFVMEQALGHVTHHQNLARWVAETPSVQATWLPISASGQDVWERVPGVRGNWSLKASLRARDALRAAGRTQSFDALFLHTQTVSLFALDWMRRVPTVISLDATPLNYDTVGREYGHVTGNDSWLERRKYQWNQRTFQAAAALTTWCQWAKDSLVNDYGVPAAKVTVIPPGVDMQRWNFGTTRTGKPADAPMRLLFVGGDFARKGGPALAEAFQSGLQRDCALDIVTKDEHVARDLQGVEGVRVHLGLTANSQALCDLYARADIFVFPTRGDCLPLAVMEAMAAGLPVIATDVGALREEVEAGVNGLIVPPDDAKAVADAVRALIADPARLIAMGHASRDLAEQRFDARRNYNAIIALVKGVAGCQHPEC